MNDILAPLFAVFLAEQIGVSFPELNQRFHELEDKIQPERLWAAEADAFFCFSLFLAQTKQNYLKGFDGVKELLKKLQSLLSRCDKELIDLLESNEIQVFHFGFRWIFCLLLRELPVSLSIKLLDYYLVEDINPGELCVYFAAVLLLRYSFKIKSLQREQIIMFLQNLPTETWGEQDIQLLVSEAFTLRNIFQKID